MKKKIYIAKPFLRYRHIWLIQETDTHRDRHTDSGIRARGEREPVRKTERQKASQKRLDFSGKVPRQLWWQGVAGGAVF